MKIRHNPFLAILIAGLIMVARLANGQSVTMGPIPAPSFCSGDPIAASFTATGFFGHRNAFTLQLSDPTGSFANGFQNIGSIMDTLPGTFTITTTIPFSLTNSIHYRFRILAAIPYIPSADNGNDITIGMRPGRIDLVNYPLAAEIDSQLVFSGSINESTTYSDSAFWDFGSGSNPTTLNQVLNNGVFSANTTYTTPGEKKVNIVVTAPGGCSISYSYILHVYDCSSPRIPHYTKVIDSTQPNLLNVFNANLWINPGVTVDISGGKDTIFSEPGSSVYGCSECLIYLKHGAVYNYSAGNSIVIYADGASIPLSDNNNNFSCPTLDFDYTNAPPNVAHPLGVKLDIALSKISLFPNPTEGIISIQGIPSGIGDLSVLNILGETVMDIKNLPAPDFSLDLPKLVPGTYYIRFSSANSVVTKKIIKN